MGMSFMIFTPCHKGYYFLFVFWRDSPPVGQGLLIHEVSRSHTTTHHRQQDSYGRVISSTQRPLPDNSQQINTYVPSVGFEPTISAGERPQTYALDRAASGTGTKSTIRIIKSSLIQLAGRVNLMGGETSTFRVLVGKERLENLYV